MDQAHWWVMDIIGPAILLIVLVWLVMRRRSNRTTSETETGTRDALSRGGTTPARRD